MRTVGLSLAVLSARAPLAAELCGGGFVIAADALPLVVCGERGQCVLLITHIFLLLYLFVLGGLVELLGPLRVQLYVFMRCTVCWGLPLWVPLRTPASFLFAPLRPQSRTPNQAIGVKTSPAGAPTEGTPPRRTLARWKPHDRACVDAAARRRSARAWL